MLNTDNINHPSHYTKNRIETIDIIKNNVENFPSFLEGNIIKYISRYRHKNGVEDLKKANWYLNVLIEEVEKGGADVGN